MKLLFFDIDGTLAYPRKSPSPSTVDAIWRARNNGHKAFLCTVRTDDSIPKAIENIGFDGGIYSAGGIVRLDKSVIAEHFMDPTTATMIIDLLQEKAVFFTLETPAGRFHSANAQTVLSQIDMTDVSKEMQLFTRNILFDLAVQPLNMYNGQSIFKIAYHSANGMITQELTQALEGKAKVVQFDNIPELPITIGEISDFSVNKGLAMLDVCNQFGMTPSDCIAFGDSMNDEEILIAAGLGIAMGNADQRVKSIANMICDRCENDGISKALSSLGLI